MPRFRVVGYTTVTDVYDVEADDETKARLIYENARELGLLERYLVRSTASSDPDAVEVNRVTG